MLLSSTKYKRETNEIGLALLEYYTREEEEDDGCKQVSDIEICQWCSVCVRMNAITTV